MWRFPICGVKKPEWETAEVPEDVGSPAPPESQPMKMGGWKVVRHDGFTCSKSSGQPERVEYPLILYIFLLFP